MNAQKGPEKRQANIFAFGMNAAHFFPTEPAGQPAPRTAGGGNGWNAKAQVFFD